MLLNKHRVYCLSRCAAAWRMLRNADHFRNVLVMWIAEILSEQLIYFTSDLSALSVHGQKVMSPSPGTAWLLLLCPKIMANPAL